MTSEQTQEILGQLAGIRRRIDELRDDWEAHRDVASVIRGLDELSVSSAAYPSVEALLFARVPQLVGIRGQVSGCIARVHGVSRSARTE
jgi:hypothetical protein